MHDETLPSFDEPQLARAVEALPSDAVDALPFGAIRLDADGNVRFYSRAEARLSGYGARPALGKRFFTDMAPCMDTEAFRGRIEAAAGTQRLDLEFGWVGDFVDRQRELTVRVQSASDGGCWIFIRREA